MTSVMTSAVPSSTSTLNSSSITSSTQGAQMMADWLSRLDQSEETSWVDFKMCKRWLTCGVVKKKGEGEG